MQVSMVILYPKVLTLKTLSLCQYLYLPAPNNYQNKEFVGRGGGIGKNKYPLTLTCYFSLPFLMFSRWKIWQSYPLQMIIFQINLCEGSLRSSVSCLEDLFNGGSMKQGPWWWQAVSVISSHFNSSELS